jgi:hypothetical protein
MQLFLFLPVKPLAQPFLGVALCSQPINAIIAMAIANMPHIDIRQISPRPSFL